MSLEEVNIICAAVTQRAKRKKELVKAHAAPSHEIMKAVVLAWVQDVRLFRDCSPYKIHVKE